MRGRGGPFPTSEATSVQISKDVKRSVGTNSQPGVCVGTNSQRLNATLRRILKLGILRNAFGLLDLATRRVSMTRRFQLFGFLFLMSVGASVQAQNPCPPLLPGNPTCYSGQDENRAYYLIAVPEAYNGRLVLWNHGYSLSPPAPLTQATDLGYPVVLLAEGFAVAASSYGPDGLDLGGWAVADASIDPDNLRLRFIDMFGRPSATYVVGASEGGIITAEIAEQFGVAKDGSLNYDGSLPMCGPLAGGRRNYYGAFALRVVYQYYCQNLPRPDEPQYPLYLGLAPDDTLTPDQLAARVNECTGILLAPEQRTPAQ